jgi:hypothetical protein
MNISIHSRAVSVRLAALLVVAAFWLAAGPATPAHAVDGDAKRCVFVGDYYICIG